MELDKISKIQKEQQERFGTIQALLNNQAVRSNIETAKKVNFLQNSTVWIKQVRYINQSAFARQLSYLPQFSKMQTEIEKLRANPNLLKAIRNDIYFQNVVVAISETAKILDSSPHSEQNKIIEEIQTAFTVEDLKTNATTDDTKISLFESFKKIWCLLEDFKKNTSLKNWASGGGLLYTALNTATLESYLLLIVFFIGCLTDNNSSEDTESNEK